jgi:subtilisin family serine protease
LPFVTKVDFVAPGAKLSSGRTRHFKNRRESGIAAATISQLSMVGIDDMHSEQVRGEGVWIAIFDSGYQGVNTAAPFQHIFANQRLADAYDFVGNTTEIFRYDDHGTEVLSVIGALSDNYTGGAYESTFSLFVTEDISGEYRVEEYNWLFAAERADSAGVDIIQSSLGYNTFDDPTMDYAKSDLDGATAVISKAASKALKKGIVVVASAGNEGTNSWRLVTPPADVDGILAIGSVTSSLSKSSFSSIGPTSDNRIKPDLVALGTGTSIVRPSGATGSANGTSLAAPIVTSLVAGVLQQFPDLTVKEVYQVLTTTASQGERPDNLLGYGIPSYALVEKFLRPIQTEDEITIYPNPTFDSIVNVWIKTVGQKVSITVQEMQGRVLQIKEMDVTWRNNPLALDLSELPNGTYLVNVKTKDSQKIERVIKKQ